MIAAMSFIWPASPVNGTIASSTEIGTPFLRTAGTESAQSRTRTLLHPDRTDLKEPLKDLPSPFSVWM